MSKKDMDIIGIQRYVPIRETHSWKFSPNEKSDAVIYTLKIKFNNDPMAFKFNIIHEEEISADIAIEDSRLLRDGFLDFIADYFISVAIRIKNGREKSTDNEKWIEDLHLFMASLAPHLIKDSVASANPFRSVTVEQLDEALKVANPPV